MAATGAALVVHDLKNALGALEARLATLSQAPDPASAVAAHRECRGLRQRLVAYLVVYGHEGPLQAHLQDESPLEVMQALLARHAGQAQQLCLPLPDAAPPQWHFDRHLVVLALEAALHNALHYARRRIELQARVDGDCLVFSVLDDGPGPDAGYGGADGADGTDGADGADRADRADGATGLGTALCRAVAQAHGCTRADGGVRLLTRAEGGACFELWLPT